MKKNTEEGSKKGSLARDNTRTASRSIYIRALQTKQIGRRATITMTTKRLNVKNDLLLAIPLDRTPGSPLQAATEGLVGCGIRSARCLDWDN